MDSQEYEKTKLYYLRTIASILKGLLHWEDEHVQGYVNDYRERLNGPKGGAIMHRTPLALIISEAIPSALKERLEGLPLVRLVKTLEEEVSKCGDCWGPSMDFDWTAARARVNKILSEYGEKLPE